MARVSGAKVVLVACLALLAGCRAAPYPSAAAPVRAIGVVTSYQEHGDTATARIAWAQAVVHGGRAISVAHSFIGEGRGFPQRGVLVSGEPVRIGIESHGEFVAGHVEQAQGVGELVSGFAHDWLVFEAEETLWPPGAPAPAWRVASAEPRSGETLHAVRATRDGASFERVPLRVVELDPEYGPMPAELVHTLNTSGVQMPGWSGCFVGRRGHDGAWELVGILVAEADTPRGGRLVVVLRPPARAIEWLRSGSGAGSRGGDPGDDDGQGE